MIRRFFPWCSLVLAACRVGPLAVGDVTDASPASPADASPPTADAEPLVEAGETLEQRLRRRCAEPRGTTDETLTAKDLTSKMLGRWFVCEAIDQPLPAGDGITLNPDGTWAMLFFDARRDALTPVLAPELHGDVRYFGFASADSGSPDAGRAERVARDDTQVRGVISVHLGFASGAADLEMIFGFEKAPRRMVIRDAGPSTSRGTLVPVD